MTNRVDIDDSWHAEVSAAVEAFLTDRLGPDIVSDAKRYCPERTGALQESIEHHLEDGDLIVSATGGDDGRTYAAYVELGTRPHVILPRDRRALFWPGAGHPVGKVDHPGTRPQPFLRPALFKERGE
ncbi:HK97 gp10 family phage protein [Kitasatospora sp. NBC_01287]|uniref:HK97 gp10 family phage protein n=1 Tax=Kitasatospora sp. NBC_01287 TaxID=2903573 RepID=UPI002254C69F|nr:HK97 gp10 family phage protein [Kitasatospora sp. NBC_01287]MCX4750902.1 HK97 gp10 family phage protein [Kitasatospora sp. NBC_01287]MCX4751861.1 HK97 gp10 family phage protein [Kitasatospora sp. NBC_01287]